MAYLVPTAHCAVGTKTLMLQVRFALPTMPHRNVFSKHSGVPVGLFSEKALQLFLQNARPSAAVRPPMGGGSFALPLLRTEMPLQDIPVFRMAYSAPTAHCAVSSETLMLQVRFAHPPNPAPSYRFFSISRRSGLRGCRHRAESTHHLTPSGCVPSGGAVAPPAPPLPPPSRCRPDRFKGSP